MRSKSIGGGRARLSKLPPQPSAMAFSYLAQPSDSEAHPDCSCDGIWVNETNGDGPYNIVPETSSDSDDDRQCHGLAPKINDNTVVAEKSCGSGPQGIHEQEHCLEMDWTEKEVCIKCDEGGKVLVCSDSSCPLAVHEECMHCAARFDSIGNFYCPYCSYKRAMLERRKARKKAMLAKKALSVFLNKGMMDGDPQKQKAKRVSRKEPNPSTVVRVTEHDDTRNRLELDGNEVDSHSLQIEEDQREEGFNPECTTSILPYKGAVASATNEQNDVMLSRCGDNARQYDGCQHKIVIGQQMHLGPIVACGGAGGACCREEETGHQFKIVHVAKSVQAEHPRLVDDHQNESVVQDEQQAGPLSASPVEEETTIGGALHISIEGELNNSKIMKENESRRPEEEEMQEQEQGTTVLSSGGDPMQQEHARTSDSFHGDNGAVSPHWRRVKKKNQNVVKPPSVDHPGRPVRKLSFEINTNMVHKEKKNAASKSRQQLTNQSFPNVRRKKLPWTAEEEEMLKEGVQKFSTMVNKNLPWRKILEFGRHVFDGTRTPVDLKDKWRNILVKECSTK